MRTPLVQGLSSKWDQTRSLRAAAREIDTHAPSPSGIDRMGPGGAIMNCTASAGSTGGHAGMRAGVGTMMGTAYGSGVQGGPGGYTEGQEQDSHQATKEDQEAYRVGIQRGQEPGTCV